VDRGVVSWSSGRGLILRCPDTAGCVGAGAEVLVDQLRSAIVALLGTVMKVTTVWPSTLTNSTLGS
jgi:hypothetical protein